MKHDPRSHFGRVLLGALALALVACSTASVDGGGVAASAVTSSDAPAPSTSSRPAPSQSFPVTVEHAFGSVTVAQMPERIVTVGLTEQDALLALGVVPVATTEWFGEHPGAIWPWAQDDLEALGGEVPSVVGDATAIQFEAIAAHQPDLILAMYAGLTQSDYDTLSAIAPTVARPDGYVDYGVPWEEITRTVGVVVGQAEQADVLVEQVTADFAAARQAHPEFGGETAVVATPYEGIYVYARQDSRGRFLTDLGFVVPEWVDEVTGNEFGGELSAERVDLLDVDAIVWLDAADTLDDDGWTVYRTLDVYAQGREVHLSSFDDTLGGATSFVSVLSLPYLLDGLVPMLAAAVDGDPATSVGT